MDLARLLDNPIFWIAILWSIAWKGVALWRSARRDSKVWFTVLLLVNTFGLLEILYLAFFSKANDTALEDASAAPD